MISLKVIEKYIKQPRYQSILEPEDMKAALLIVDLLAKENEIRDEMKTVRKLMALQGYLVSKYTGWLNNQKLTRDQARGTLYKQIKSSGEKMTEKAVDSEIIGNKEYIDRVNYIQALSEIVDLFKGLHEAIRTMQFTLYEMSKSDRDMMALER